MFGKLIPCHYITYKYFHPFCRLSFCFIYGFLCCAKTFKVCLCFIYVFLLLSLLPEETELRKYCYSLCQRMFCLCSWSFMVSYIFRSFNHVEVIIVYGVRECSNFTDLHVAVSLAEETVFYIFTSFVEG